MDTHLKVVDHLIYRGFFGRPFYTHLKVVDHLIYRDFFGRPFDNTHLNMVDHFKFLR